MDKYPRQSVEGEDPDLELVRRVVGGDTRAFEALVRRHERRVYRTALGVTGKPEDAEEAAQETFLKAFQHLGEFRGDARFSTWLTRIAVNEGLQIRRRRRPAESLDDPESTVKPLATPGRIGEWHENPEAVCGRAELRELVEDAVASLPAAYRTAFVLRDLEGLSHEETAAAMGLSLAAAKSRILRARLMMRERMAARLERPATLRTRWKRARWRVGAAARMMWGPSRPREQEEKREGAGE